MLRLVSGALALVASLAVLASAPTPFGGTAKANHAATTSADELIFWIDCNRDLVQFSDAELDMWKARGVDGFVCVVQRLRGFGGGQDFTGNPNADLSAPNYELQRKLRDSRIGARAAARGMKLYLGFYLSNSTNQSTPLKDWFDDAGWAQSAVPKIRDLSAAAKLLGFQGVAFDQELYGTDASWNWDYPGNTHTEAEVRAKATQRGQEVMQAILSGFPGAELAVYHWYWPETWREVVMEQNYGRTNAFARNTNWNFFDGITRVEGYKEIHLYDSVFYKTPHYGSWDATMQYNVSRSLAFMSRKFANWDYASSRVSVSPFSWIDEGPQATTTWDDAKSPAYVREQLMAMRKWGMGEFANYAYRSIRNFDYSPYVSALQDASTPANVDGAHPTLRVNSTANGSPPATIQGTANDNLAIRAVRWEDDRGRSGAAQLNWHVLSGGYTSAYNWEMRWSFPSSKLSPGATRVTITAEDIKGNPSQGSTLSWGAPQPDTTPPETTVITGPAPTTPETDASFTYQASEASSTFACRIDGGAWQGCPASGTSYSGLAEGAHTFEVAATDAAGNADPTPASHAWAIDATAPPPDPPDPKTQLLTAPPKRLEVLDRRARVGFAFAAPVPATGFKCRLNGRRWKRCEGGTVEFGIRTRGRWRGHLFMVKPPHSAAAERIPATRYRFEAKRLPRESQQARPASG